MTYLNFNKNCNHTQSYNVSFCSLLAHPVPYTFVEIRIPSVIFYNDNFWALIMCRHSPAGWNWPALFQKNKKEIDDILTLVAILEIVIIYNKYRWYSDFYGSIVYYNVQKLYWTSMYCVLLACENHVMEVTWVGIV